MRFLFGWAFIVIVINAEKSTKFQIENEENNSKGNIIGVNSEAEQCCLKVYEDGKMKGANMKICGKCNECMNLPKEWQNRVSSYAAHNLARFYTGKNCRGHSEKACRDFTYTGFLSDVNNLWGLMCSVKDLNNNTKSLKMKSDWF